MTSITHEGVTYPVSYCSLCEAHKIDCPTCRNNTCNGGYGRVEGRECPSCPKAYEVSAKYEKLLRALDA